MNSLRSFRFVFSSALALFVLAALALAQAPSAEKKI